MLGNPPEPKVAGDLTAVRVWDINTGQQTVALRSENERLKCMAISPDSSIIAAGSITGNIYLWSLASDKPIAKLAGHRNSIFSLDFSPDGKRLVSGSDDTTILVWDVAPWTDVARKPHVPLGNDAAQLWKALAETTSPYPAIERFLRAPKETVEFLRGKLHPPEMDVIRRNITALDSSKFAEREQAMAALHKLGMEARPALLAVLQGKPTLEVRRRAQMLLAKLENEPLPGDSMQTLRGLDILEQLATPEALQFLDNLSKGDPDTWLTQEARWALKRARKRIG